MDCCGELKSMLNGESSRRDQRRFEEGLSERREVLGDEVFNIGQLVRVGLDPGSRPPPSGKFR